MRKYSALVPRIADGAFHGSTETQLRFDQEVYMRSEPFGWAKEIATAIAIGLSIVGCGGDSATGPGGSSSETGSFELSYSGDTSGTVSGIAYFSQQGLPAGDRFLVVFGRDFSEAHDADTGFQLGRNAPLPAPGTYDLTAVDVTNIHNWPEGSFGLGIQVNANASTEHATGGSVTVTEVNSDRIRGDFSATFTGGITATGTFDAVSCVDNVENCPLEL